MWEFSDSRLGYSYGAPSLVKTRKYGWTVVFTSGYENSDGKGWFFFVNPATGELLEAVATGEGSTAEPLDMAHHSLYVADMGDYTADAVYAGDLRGNVWRVDLTGDSGTYPSPVKIAVLTNEKGKALPVTTRPLIEIDPATERRYVMVGSGRLLGDSDIRDAERQAFYAIVDGKRPFGGFYANGAPGVGFPARRASFASNTDVTKGVGATKSSVGWYLDLGLANGIAKRVDVQPTSSQGTVAFAANVPNGEVCNPDGNGEGLVVAFGSGRSVLVDPETGSLVASVALPRRVRDVEYKRVHGSIRVYIGDSGGTITKVPTALPGGGTLRWIGWREVSSRD
jgi:type IV pilus assembly protein PilY1